MIRVCLYLRPCSRAVPQLSGRVGAENSKRKRFDRSDAAMRTRKALNAGGFFAVTEVPAGGEPEELCTR